MEKYYLPGYTKIFLNKMIKHVTQILDEYDIIYFADGGTLLGAIRDKGQIPWDDDIDLGVIGQEDFFIKLPNALQKLNSMGYSIKHNDPFLVKIYIANEAVELEDRIIGTPTLDIFCWEQTSNQVRLMSLIHRNTWTRCYHNIEDFYPLNKLKFDDTYIIGPHNPLNYLHRMYPDYMQKAKIDIRNKENNKLESITFDLHTCD